MKRKNYLYIVGVTILLCSGCDNANSDSAANIQLPEPDAITELQLNLTRLSADDYPDAKLADLVEDIESAELVDVKEAENMCRPEDYLTITLRYEDDSRDTFYFFQNGEEWYMETEAGVFYRNAEFVQDYISKAEVTLETEFSPELDVSRMQLELEKRFDTLDEKYEFAFDVQADMQFQGMTEEEAIVLTKASLMEKYQIYQYALQSGIEISDEELDQILKQYQETFADDIADSEYQSIYEEAGTTPQESLEKNRELIRTDKTIEKLYQKLQKDFQDGNTKVGDKDCSDMYAYYQAYVEEVVKTSIGETEQKEIEKSLDDAEAYYREFVKDSNIYTESESLMQEVGKRFLEQVFTSDYEERYTEFLKDENVEKYYKTFSDYASQECIENLKQNRIPVKYDKEAEEENSFYIVSDIDLKFDETGTGTFEVLLADKKNTDEAVQKATGQITIEDKKVNTFFLSNVVLCEN